MSAMATCDSCLTARERAAYARYARLALPRHTSYPAVPFWSDAYNSEDYGADLEAGRRARKPLGLYVHVPFCEKLCFYSACTREIVPKSEFSSTGIADSFLDALESEARRLAGDAGGGDRWVHQIHLGGGTPSYLTCHQLERLVGILQQNFRIAPDGEFSVEIDARSVSLEQLATLRGLGCNRVSLGIQDFDPRVQRAVNRLQSFEVVKRVVDGCRALGIASLNFDLIYGLPFQTLNSMEDTLEKTLALGPDRVAFYRLAVIPEMFRWQKVFKPADLPSGEIPLELMLLALRCFTSEGYEFIGLDHFARPNEALAQARQARALRRSFQGMTTGRGLEVLGIGPSAISLLGNSYAQNAKDSAEWRTRVRQGYATVRGWRLSAEDQLRGELLQRLYSYGEVDTEGLEREFGVSFATHFAGELTRLRLLEEDGLIEHRAGSLGLKGLLGRLLARVPAAVFDAYLPPEAFHQGLSSPEASRVG